MRVFWLNGGLQVVPENHREWTMLTELARNLKFGEPPETECISGGQSELGSEGLLESVIGGQEASPSGLSGKARNKQPIVFVNKLL